MKRKTYLSWSSGKDSAWALHMLQQQPETEVAGLFCTVNSEFNRVAMHAVRVELLVQQAKNVGLPIHLIPIPYPCTNNVYEEAMSAFICAAKKANIEYFAFGDLFLEDIRSYREAQLSGSGITPIFPLWKSPTDELSQTMLHCGLKAIITCIDPKPLSRDFVGREYNQSFLKDIPAGVDPCGEYGEFHTFAFDGPMFRQPVEMSLGAVVSRDGFVFADLLPTEQTVKTDVAR